MEIFWEKQQMTKKGNISFDIPVDHEGEFEYTLEEVNGKDTTIKYDGKVYKVIIRVKFDRLANILNTELVYIDEEVTS